MQINPADNCQICPRLAEFRKQNQQKYPDFFNAPIPVLGEGEAETEANAQVAIVGLAPGLKGANQTGRAFTGDHAGNLLYDVLQQTGFTSGNFAPDGKDNLQLVNCRIINAVRCVPPQNKPTTQEIINCSPYLMNALQQMKQLKIIVALGKIAHDSILRSFQQKLSSCRFAHGATHHLSHSKINQSILLLDSYHCSRYNTQTGRLSAQQFLIIFQTARKFLT